MRSGRQPQDRRPRCAIGTLGVLNEAKQAYAKMEDAAVAKWRGMAPSTRLPTIARQLCRASQAGKSGDHESRRGGQERGVQGEDRRRRNATDTAHRRQQCSRHPTDAAEDEPLRHDGRRGCEAPGAAPVRGRLCQVGADAAQQGARLQDGQPDVPACDDVCLSCARSRRSAQWYAKLSSQNQPMAQQRCQQEALAP